MRKRRRHPTKRRVTRHDLAPRGSGCRERWAGGILGSSCTAGLIRPGLTSDGESIVFQKGEGLPCFGPKAKTEIPNE